MAKHSPLIILLIIAATLLVACIDNPNPYPTGATPIPTLIPVDSSLSNVVYAAEAEPLDVSYPAGLPSAANGQALYDEHCVECHGVAGKGLDPAARDFSDADYRRGETPADFYLAITEGHGSAGATTDMPSFGSLLTSDQRWDVVYYTWRFAAPDESLVAGQEIYRINCEDCHGPTGRSMILGAADFSDQIFMSNETSSDLFVSVTQGKDSMPAWQARLDQDSRWSVIDYIRTFTYDPVLVMPEGEEAAGEGIVFAPSEPEVLEKPECAAEFLSQSNPHGWDDAAALAAGEELYAQFCSRCHGSDGAGVADLAYVPSDLSSPAVQTFLREQGGEYLCRISEGLFEMPAFKRQMDQEQMWQILTYVGALGD